MARLASEIIAADALGRNFKSTQSLGRWISSVLPEVFKATIFEGFSYFSAEECHEERHGENTCSFFKARDYVCDGKYFPGVISNVCLPKNGMVIYFGSVLPNKAI